MAEQRNNLLSISNLSLGYSPAITLVESIQASVGAGEMIALVGRNGSGKSTLLRTLAGIQNIRKGEVRMNDKNIGSMHPAELSSLISFVGTGFREFADLTVFELVSLGRHPYTNWWGALREADKQRIMESLKFVGMDGFVRSRINNLSDGERQRVMIAMSLAQDTPLLILDEPTAYLDIPNRITIAEVLFKLKDSGRSILFSTHDFDIAFAYADQIWIINDNKMLIGAPEDLGIQGAYDQLFSNSGLAFDQKNMRFGKSRKITKKICLHNTGNSSVDYWTSRSLERAGFKVVKAKDADLAEIFIEQRDEELCWILRMYDTSRKYNSLYELTRDLKLGS